MKGNIYDLKQIRLFLGEDKQQVNNMINIFLQETPLMIAELRRNLEEKNYDEIKFFAHKLKSSIDLFQIKGLQDDIRILEQLTTEQKNIPAIEKYVNYITSTMEDVVEEIKKEIS